MSKVRVWLMRSFAALIAIPLVLVLLLVVLLNTAAGTDWLLRQTLPMVNTAALHISYAKSNGALFDQLHVQQLKIVQPQQQILLEDIQLAWQPLALFEGWLKIRRLHLTGVSVQLPETSAPSDQPPSIPDIVLPLQVAVEDFLLEELYLPTVSQSPVVEKLHLKAIADFEAIALTLHEFKHPQAQLRGRLKMASRAPHTIDGELNLQADVEQVGETVAQVNLSGLALQPQLKLKVMQPAPVEGSARLDLTTLLPGFDISLNSPQLQWPLQAEADYQLADTYLTISGNASAYKLALDTQLQGRQIPEMTVSLQGNGSDQFLNLRPLKARLPDGVMQITGKVNWLPAVDWDLQLHGDGLNPGLYDPQWPGALNARLELRGRLQEGEPVVDVVINQLEGVLREFPVDAKGHLAYRQQQLQTKDVNLRMGDNRIVINGRLQDELDFLMDINAPALQQLHPQLSGSLLGQLKLSGTPAKPGLTGKLEGISLAFAGQQVKHLTLDGNWLADNGSITLSLDDIWLSDTHLHAARLSLDGALQQHDLQLNVNGLDQDISLLLAGGYDGQQWQGQWQATELKNIFMTLKQDKPAALKVSSKGFSLAPWCLANNEESLCLQSSWAADTDALMLKGQLQSFALSHLKPLIGSEMEITGMLSGDFTVEGTSAKPRARMNIVPSDGVFAFNDDAEQLQIPYRNALIKMDYIKDRVIADLGFELGENGKAKGHFEMDEGPSRTLSGQLQAALPDLRLVQGFVPDLKDVSGNLDAVMRLGGTIENPRLNGAVKLQNGRASLAAAGLEFTDLQLQADANDNQQLKLNGSVKSGEGYLQITGDIDAGKIPAHIDLQLKGDRFQVARLPNADVEVSPDLKLVGRDVFQLTGELLVPKAVIELYELPASVDSVSSDEIIVDKPATKAGKGRPVKADVQLKLGEQVSFSGFGLKSGFVGMLEAEYDGKQSRLYGRIEMKEAAYKAYGQDLKVVKGRLLFAGAPDNPAVDLKASRQSLDKETTAFIAVSGRLSQPKIRVYSEPSLPEAEALAYLITGRNLSQADKESGNEISAAALSLGLNKSLPALSEMGERLGIDEISFDTSEGYDESSVKIGKYLNPDFYIGYSHGLFDAEGALMLNYKINEYLDLESLSGTSESVDLYYRFEHD